MQYLSVLTLAQCAPSPGGAPGGQQSPGFMLGWLVIMLAIFYFMLIRPQQRKEKERRQLIDSVKTGNRVLFGGGILGTVTNVKDKVLVVKIADGVKIEVLRSSVSSVLDKEDKDEKENGGK